VTHSPAERAPAGRWLVPAIAVVATMGLTAAVWSARSTATMADASAEADFQRDVHRAEALVQTRLVRTLDLIRAGKALLRGSNTVHEDEWRLLLDTFDLEAARRDEQTLLFIGASSADAAEPAGVSLADLSSVHVDGEQGNPGPLRVLLGAGETPAGRASSASAVADPSVRETLLQAAAARRTMLTPPVRDPVDDGAGETRTLVCPLLRAAGDRDGARCVGWVGLTFDLEAHALAGLRDALSTIHVSLASKRAAPNADTGATRGRRMALSVDAMDLQIPVRFEAAAGAYEPDYTLALVLLVGGCALTLTTAGMLGALVRTGRRSQVLADRMTASLKEHESRLRRLALVASKTENAVIITDAQGRIEWVNDGFTRITEYTLDEVAGRTPGSILQGEKTDPETARSMSARVPAGEGFQEEIYNYAKSGRGYWLRCDVDPIFDESGELTNFIAIERDITEERQARENLEKFTRDLLWSQKEQERQAAELEAQTLELERAWEQAEAANEAKSAFLANMSHEIRTPMTAILGFADLLAEPDAPEQERAEAVETIRRNGRHLLGVINDVLDLSKVEAGRMEINLARCSPEQVVADVASLMRARAESRGLWLRVEQDGPMPRTIETGEMRVRQILMNLVGNALKFTDEGGVRITSRIIERGRAPGEDPMLEVDVADTGAGVPEEHLAELFTPFAQVDASSSRRFGGAGLGLAICRSLSELLGGSISVRSERGKGSVFTFRVAAGRMQWEDDASAQAANTPGPAEAEETRLDARVLLVEDGPDNQRLISVLLRKAGAEVDLACDGREAIDRAVASRERGEPFDLILMDMQMPGIDGYEATRRLRNLDWAGPILALTAHAMSGDRERCIEAGCDDYATKPIDRASLMETCRGLINASASKASSRDGV